MTKERVKIEIFGTRTGGLSRLIDETPGCVVDEVDAELTAHLLEDLGARGESRLWIGFARQTETGDQSEPLDLSQPDPMPTELRQLLLRNQCEYIQRR